jgi:hypothetical protein
MLAPLPPGRTTGQELEAIETIIAIGGADDETATAKQIAGQTGLSVQTVRRRLQLRSLIAELRRAFDEVGSLPGSPGPLRAYRKPAARLWPRRSDRETARERARASAQVPRRGVVSLHFINHLGAASTPGTIFCFPRESMSRSASDSCSCWSYFAIVPPRQQAPARQGTHN